MPGFSSFPRNYWERDECSRILDRLGKDGLMADLFIGTNPAGNSLGFQRLSASYLADHLPFISVVRAEEVLQQLADMDRISRDTDRHLVFAPWVMQAHFGRGLAPGDKRLAYIRRLLGQWPNSPLTARIVSEYGMRFHLTDAPHGALTVIDGGKP